MSKQLTPDDLIRFEKNFDFDSRNTLVLNAITAKGLKSIALNREAINRSNHIYSYHIDTPEATNQKSSGRCWLFAGLNTLRVTAMKNMILEEFELSQAYSMFWDKLEKANYFLNNIIETLDEPLDGRIVMHLLMEPIPDGGQWDMFVNIIKKYGVIPKSFMPETYSSSNSWEMDDILQAKLREYASQLRDMNDNRKSLEEIYNTKDSMMNEFFKMLTFHLGKPPKSFYWEWRDKDKKFTRCGEITPIEFYNKYININLDDYICLINAPTKDKPYNKMYTVQYLGNVVGGQGVRYLNLEIDILKKAASEMIKNNEPVWFGCDVGQMLEGKIGLLDNDIYNYELIYDTKFKFDKAKRLDYGESRMNHAMVLTGVDIDDNGKILKWRVENSWGIKEGDKGYLMMTDKWFDEFVYEVSVNKKYLSPELIQIIDTKPIVLKPWDPMGSLAKAR